MDNIKFPEVHVKMVGEDGNAFSILGRVSKALKREGHRDMVDSFIAEASASDYDHLLRVVVRWVSVY